VSEGTEYLSCCACTSLLQQQITASQMQVVTGIAPVASLVNWVGGEVTYVYGGCVYVLANRTNITSLRDLVDTKVQAH